MTLFSASLPECWPLKFISPRGSASGNVKMNLISCCFVEKSSGERESCCLISSQQPLSGSSLFPRCHSQGIQLPGWTRCHIHQLRTGAGNGCNHDFGVWVLFRFRFSHLPAVSWHFTSGIPEVLKSLTDAWNPEEARQMPSFVHLIKVTTHLAHFCFIEIRRTPWEASISLLSTVNLSPCTPLKRQFYCLPSLYSDGGSHRGLPKHTKLNEDTTQKGSILGGWGDILQNMRTLKQKCFLESQKTC